MRSAISDVCAPVVRMLGDGNVEMLEYPSTFPVERRPVYFWDASPRIMVDHRMSAVDERIWISRIDAIIRSRAEELNRSGIIQSVSYSRARRIMQMSRFADRMIWHDDSSGSERAIEEFKARANKGAVLISPSMTMGVNFPDCLGPTTRVLTADLRWVEIQHLRVGDRLGAFDENPGTRADYSCHRSWTTSVVTKKELVFLPSYKLTFDDGTFVTASSDHKWLVRRQAGFHKWIKTANLILSVGKRLGTCVAKLVETWDSAQLNNWEIGYLAGAFDGEGHLHQGDKSKSTHGNQINALAMSQARNEMLTEVRRILSKRGYRYRIYTKRNRKVRLAHPKWKQNFSVQIAERRDFLRFLGEVRPPRLLPKLNWDRLGVIRAKPSRLVAKEYVGISAVVALQTTTGTLIAEGLATHNSECRFILWPKMPYPDMRSAVMQRRAKLDRRYAGSLMMKALQQGCGRGNRHINDWSEAIILDGHAKRWLWEYQEFMAGYFRQALRTTLVMPQPLMVEEL